MLTLIEFYRILLQRVKVNKQTKAKEYNMKEKLYMNPDTETVDTYDGWSYKDNQGYLRNYVADGVVFEATRVDGQWIDVE